MPFISAKSAAQPRSLIREIFAMQTGMNDVVSFALGEPDFTSPKYIIQGAIDSLNRGETFYAPGIGILPLREELSRAYSARGLNYSPAEIMIGQGAISLLNLAFTTVLDIGDEIILADPGWTNYFGLAAQIGAKAVPVPVLEDDDFMYDPAALEAAITPKTKIIMLNSPANPTGGVASKARLEAIADIARRRNLYIISDEVYRELLWSDEPYTSIASLPGMKERTILIDSFSKTFAMTGFRVGYCAAPHDVIDTMVKLTENVLSSVSTAMQWGGVAALRGGHEAVDEMREIYRRRRKLLIEGLNEIPGISCRWPGGAFYAFANIKKLGIPSRDFCVRLLKEKGTAVIPGIGFGSGGEGFVRLTYATSEQNIAEGLRRIAEFVSKIG